MVLAGIVLVAICVALLVFIAESFEVLRLWSTLVIDVTIHVGYAFATPTSNDDGWIKT